MVTAFAVGALAPAVLGLITGDVTAGGFADPVRGPLRKQA